MHKVLVTDDEAYIATQIEERLTSMGYDVVGVASSGEEAIDMSRTFVPDLVLMDIVMPGKLNGIGAARIIKDELDIPVIFLTAYTEDQLIDEAKNAEPFGYIVKPLQEREIKAAIEIAIHKKDVDRQLHESEKKYRLLVSNIPCVVFTGYKDFSVDFIDDKVEELTGYSSEDFNSRKLKWSDIVIEDDIQKIVEDFTNALKGDKKYSRKYRIKSKEGEILWIWEKGQITCDDQREILFVSGVFSDITHHIRVEEEKRRLEDKLHQARKMESIGILAGGIAHDFNNLLMGIQGNASLTLLDMDSTYPGYERLKNIEQYTQNGAELTGQLLGFARGGKYEVKPTDMNELIKKSSSMFGRTRKEIKIYRKYQEDIWTVEVDQGQIEQTLLNLYVNASQAMPGGGNLYLQTENITLDENYVKPYDLEPGRYVKISLTDSGVGMDEETKDRIFDPFFTTKEMGSGKGIGLGLASVYGIITNHGGIINVQSKKGEGATFNIYLPASESEIITEKKLPEKFLRGTETVLFVDDEKFIISISEDILKKLGYTVLIARNGKEAIEIYKEKQDDIDMVLLDMIMPEMGGGETYDILKKINPDIKVLLSSGYSIEGQATEILERGCDGFIQKPFKIEHLSQIMRRILEDK